ncbi:MAG: endonuclease/exonuclease/phosphatase family protein [Acidimicrobiales bacterium]
MRVATFNLHAGVDGWGRRTNALDVAIALAPDVLIAPETWRGDDGDDAYATLSSSLSMQGTFAPLARGERVSTGTGGRTWQPRLAHFTGEHGLYFTEHRDLTTSQHQRRRHGDLEPGTWGLSLLTRLPVEQIRVEEVDRQPREKVRRAVILATLRDGDRRFHVMALHGAHLSHGSYRQYHRVREIVATLDPALPMILGGDFNSWRPLLRLFLPGWRSLARARTWPGRHPHSQIDHLLARGPWRILGAGSRDGGSDHRALYADVVLDDVAG